MKTDCLSNTLVSSVATAHVAIQRKGGVQDYKKKFCCARPGYILSLAQNALQLEYDLAALTTHVVCVNFTFYS